MHTKHQRAALLILLVLAIIAMTGAAQRTPSIVKVSHTSDFDIAVSCKNGADPTGTKIGHTLIISCGR